MLKEQVFIACVLSFLAGALLIHYLGPAGKRARRLHKALTRLSTVHDTYYADSQEALIDLDKLSERLRRQLGELRDEAEKSARSIGHLHDENDLLYELLNNNREIAMQIGLIGASIGKTVSGISYIPKKVDDALANIKGLADLIIGPASNEQETKSGPKQGPAETRG